MKKIIFSNIVMNFFNILILLPLMNYSKLLFIILVVLSFYTIYQLSLYISKAKDFTNVFIKFFFIALTAMFLVSTSFLFIFIPTKNENKLEDCERYIDVDNIKYCLLNGKIQYLNKSNDYNTIETKKFMYNNNELQKKYTMFKKNKGYIICDNECDHAVIDNQLFEISNVSNIYKESKRIEIIDKELYNIKDDIFVDVLINRIKIYKKINNQVYELIENKSVYEITNLRTHLIKYNNGIISINYKTYKIKYNKKIILEEMSDINA